MNTQGLFGKPIFKNPKNKTLTFILVFTLIIMIVVIPGKFFTASNFQSMASQFPEFGFLALAMMLAMITGGIDLSIVSIANFTGVLAAIILTRASGLPANISIIFAVIVTLFTALLCGLFNGALIAFIGVPPILATLGTQGLFMGLSIAITKGYSISGFPKDYAILGNGSILGIPLSFAFFIIFAYAVYLLLTRTRQGFYMFMVGSSPVVSRFSGVENTKVLIKTYILTAVLAGMASIIMTSRVNSMRPGYGTDYILQAILVVVLGGVDPDGGFGSVLGLVMGILILQFTQSGLNILAFSPFFKKFTWGFALLAVMIINYLAQTHKDKKHSHENLETQRSIEGGV